MKLPILGHWRSNPRGFNLTPSVFEYRGSKHWWMVEKLWSCWFMICTGVLYLSGSFLEEVIRVNNGEP